MTWPALLLAPLLVLLQLSTLQALTTPACTHHNEWLPHVVCATSLLLMLGMTLLAGYRWHRLVHSVRHLKDEGARSRDRFVATVATLTGVLSSLVGASLWLPVFALAPCLS